MKYEVWNYNTTKTIARCNDLKSAMKRAYKEQMAHRRLKFAVVREDGASPGFTEMDCRPGYENKVIFQKHKMGSQDYIGAYRLYSDGTLKNL